MVKEDMKIKLKEILFELFHNRIYLPAYREKITYSKFIVILWNKFLYLILSFQLFHNLNYNKPTAEKCKAFE